MNFVQGMRIYLLAGLPCLLSSLPAWAEEGGDKGGLPQLDTSLFPEQLFWLAVTFATLYVFMAFVALPGVKRAQDKRQSTLATALEIATTANQEAKSTLAHYEKSLADAHAKARVTVNEIRTQTTNESNLRQAEQQKALAKRLHLADANIRTTRDQAIKNIHQDALDLARKIVEKISSVKNTPATKEPS